MDALSRILNKKAIFIKYWDNALKNIVFKKTPLVGNIEGISASNLGGSNIGINKFITDERQKDSAEVLKFITSYEVQKYLVMNYKACSGINSLYDDKEVCEVYDCDLAKSIQFISRPSSITNNYDEYSKYFRQYLYEFLYENEDVEWVLEKIDDIVKIYEITIDTSETLVGLIVFAITLLIIIMISLSFIFLLIEKYKKIFNFFSIDLWILIFIGFILSLCFIFTEYGEVNKLRCSLKYYFLNQGLTLIFIPIFYRLLINFPFKSEDNKYYKWIKGNKFLIIFLFVLYDIILILIFIIPSVDIRVNEIVDGKNFRICHEKNKYENIILSLFYSEKIIILFANLLLIFMEWNLYTSIIEIRLITLSLYATFLISIGFIIYYFINIKDYISYFIIRSMIIILFVLSNHIFLYGSRLLLYYSAKGKKPKLRYIKPASTVTTNNFSNSKTNSKIITDMKKSRNSVLSIILSYHYYLGKDNDIEEGIISTNNYSTISSFKA